MFPYGIALGLQLASYVCLVITPRKSKDQPGKVINPAGSQLDRENEIFPVPVHG